MIMDFDGPGFGPWGNWWHALNLVIAGFAWLLFLALILAVLFFLIRFLIVATRAAQLYVNQHAPAEPARPSTPAATTAPAATAAPAPTTQTAATKPVTKPRTPRNPTT